MTGWRLGWLVLPADLVRPVEVLAQNLFISPPTVSQLAGLAAFDCRDELDASVARYAARRQIVVDGLAAAGITKIAPPDGAFYVWADVSHLGADSQVLCAEWLAELGVAATPGIDFDPSRGHHFVRHPVRPATREVVVGQGYRLKSGILDRDRGRGNGRKRGENPGRQGPGKTAPSGAGCDEYGTDVRHLRVLPFARQPPTPAQPPIQTLV